MTSWQTVVTAIKTTAARLKQSFSEFPRPIQVIIVISVLGYCVAVVLAYRGLGDAWHYDSWDDLFWPNLWPVVAFCPLAFLDRFARLREPAPVDAPAEAETPRPKRPIGLIAMIVLSLPGLLLFPLGWGAQKYESFYYGELAGRVQAEMPLYQDSFATSDGAWCAPQATSSHSERAAYVGSAYQLSGSAANQFADSRLRFAYSSFAIEVTVKEMGASSQYGGVGLELRADASGMLAFVVDEEGYWGLWDYDQIDSNPQNDWLAMYLGHSTAIHQGSSPTNHLLAIVHGNQFILYVNGAYVTELFLRDHDTPSSGQVGVYANDAMLPTRFTDFAVYPLPSMAPALPLNFDLSSTALLHQPSRPVLSDASCGPPDGQRPAIPLGISDMALS